MKADTSLSDRQDRVIPDADASHRRDFIMVLLSAWLMGGLFVDGYAHQNIDSTLETFFTPWHALFYSGFLATAGWMIWSAKPWEHRERGFWASVPAGYRMGMAGLPVFILGGVVDVWWHIRFGIELEIDALVSPPHLFIVSGVLMMVTSPLRAAWSKGDYRPSLARFFPALASMTLAAALISFMFMYLSAFVAPDMGAPLTSFIERSFEGSDRGFVRTMTWRAGIASVLSANLLLVGPALLLLRRWDTPMGSMTIMFTAVAILMTSLFGFAAAAFVIPAGAAGATIDLAAPRLRERGAWGLRMTGFLAPLVLWLGYVGVVAATDGLGWPFTLWTGTVFWTGLSGLGLALLVFPQDLPGSSISSDPAAPGTERLSRSNER